MKELLCGHFEDSRLSKDNIGHGSLMSMARAQIVHAQNPICAYEGLCSFGVKPEICPRFHFTSNKVQLKQHPHTQ